jgi:3-hydroxy-3-methylglutaryl CoA synthase
LIAADPRIAAIAPQCGRASKEVYDVARPTATSEWNDPVLSLYSYLDLVEGAWSHYAELVGAKSVEQHFRYMLYHAPLASLVERAHRVLLDASDDDVTAESSAASFGRMVAPSLRYNWVLGNIYSGSLYASLAGLIDDPSTELDAPARIGCFSYGSGACSELFALNIMPTARATLHEQRIDGHVEERRRLSIDDYERQIQELQSAMPLGTFEPDLRAQGSLFDTHYVGRGRLVLERVENHYRRYRWV